MKTLSVQQPWASAICSGVKDVENRTWQPKEQTESLNKSIQKMQETNSQLQKSLDKLTTQNVQAQKDLNEAKDKARDLEKQLQEALSKNNGCSSGCLGMVATIVTVGSATCWLICIL